MNQGEGFSGRPEKPEDACYSFWMGAALKLIDCMSDVFLLSYQVNSGFCLGVQRMISRALKETGILR